MRLEEFDFEVRYKKEKENVVADALWRIEINTKETLIAQNDDDDDQDFLSVLSNVDMDEDLTTFGCDEILNTDALQHDNKSEEQFLIHNIHLPRILYLQCLYLTINPVNNFKNRMVLKLGDKYNIEYSRPFQKHHYIVSLRRGQECEKIAQMLKEITNPNALSMAFALAMKLLKNNFVNFLENYLTVK